jgi:hypothetical protein
MTLRPGDHDCDETRKAWNGMINRRPALIVHCVGTDDVIACVGDGRLLRVSECENADARKASNTSSELNPAS